MRLPGNIHTVRINHHLVGQLSWAVFQLIDSTNIRVKRFEKNDKIRENIVKVAGDFVDSVMQCRAEMIGVTEEDELWAIAAKYEPDVQYTEVYKQFQKDIWRNPKGALPATQEIEDHAIALAKGKFKVDDIKKEIMQVSEIEIRSFMRDNNIDQIEMANGCKITLRARLSIPYKKILE